MNASITRSLLYLGVAALLVPLTSAAAGCGGCDKKSCVQPGIYLYSGDLPVGTAVEICVDGNCHTSSVLAVVQPAIDKLGSLLEDQVPLPLGKRVEVSITVRDATGKTLGQLTDNRGVPSGSDECHCPSLIYQWTTGGKITRFGER